MTSGPIPDQGEAWTFQPPSSIDAIWAHERRLVSAVDLRETTRIARRADGYLMVVRGHWYFKRSRQGDRDGATCYLKERHGKGAPQRIRFWAAYEHCVGATGRSELSGHKHCAVIGYRVKGDPPVGVVPMVIGRLVAGRDDFPLTVGRHHYRIRPSQIDAFEDVDLTRSATREAREAVEAMKERTIKARLARILGEPYVPKDHGGERSDLFTRRLRLAGADHHAAFIMKGRGTRGRMTVRDLGHNGDQLERALHEPVDLVGVVNNGPIDSLVFQRLEQACFYHDRRLGQPRRWFALDGEDLARIFGQSPEGGR